MIHLSRISWLALVLLAMGAGCERAPDLLPNVPGGTTGDTVYVQVYPPFGGFTGPQDVLVGNDQLIYVADTRGNRIVMMNLAGIEMSERSILHPVSIAQDLRLDLLVGGEIVAANGDTVGSIFRIHLVSQSPDSAHRLDLARIDTVWTENARPQRRFPGIVALPDNGWIAARTGTDNSSIIDPDARVLLFDAQSQFRTPIDAFLSQAGSGITDINFPTGIAAFPNSRDFVLVQSSQGVTYAAQWMIYQNTTEFEGWVPRFDPSNAIDRLVDFIKPNRYRQPEAVAIDHARRDIFVADAALDSIFKFNSRGVFKQESFGVAKTMLGNMPAMLKPMGLSFFNKVLYVADDSLGVILRFTLTTDFPR